MKLFYFIVTNNILNVLYVMKRFNRGDRMTYDETEKLKKLYSIYEQPMYRIAYAVLHDEGLAEDAVSEAFIRIMRKLSKFSNCED
ncbi:MAG: hypothetical protein IJJ57_02015, partial [Ruminococcus sp.]|nr:hypothetical protein [Ruminococcus sp.]